MPEFVFSGHSETTYPSSRDAHALPVGTVGPGDIRDLDEPLDGNWLPVDGNDEDPPAGGDGGGEAGNPASLPPAATPPVTGPQPAPPAVIPATTQEG